MLNWSDYEDKSNAKQIVIPVQVLLKSESAADCNIIKECFNVK